MVLLFSRMYASDVSALRYVTGASALATCT